MKKNALNVLLNTDLFWKWRETWSRIPKTKISSSSKWRVQRMGFLWLLSILGRESSARPVMDPQAVSDLAALLPAVVSKFHWLPCCLYLFIFLSPPFFTAFYSFIAMIPPQWCEYGITGIWLELSLLEGFNTNCQCHSYWATSTCPCFP